MSPFSKCVLFGEESSGAEATAAAATLANASEIPDEFKCPIGLELMQDPVIISSGQTYDRSAIQRWIDSGHSTCPKSGQKLEHAKVIPNHALRSLIRQWCEDHKLSVVQKQVVCEFRLLVKCGNDKRVCIIAEADAIPFLVPLLASRDAKTQENAITAILNLSICDVSQKLIVAAGAVDPILAVLKSGSTVESRENAAATLCNLSVVDEYKVLIGSRAETFPSLVTLLRDGSCYECR